MILWADEGVRFAQLGSVLRPEPFPCERLQEFHDQYTSAKSPKMVEMPERNFSWNAVTFSRPCPLLGNVRDAPDASGAVLRVQSQRVYPGSCQGWLGGEGPDDSLPGSSVFCTLLFECFLLSNITTEATGMAGSMLAGGTMARVGMK